MLQKFEIFEFPEVLECNVHKYYNREIFVAGVL